MAGKQGFEPQFYDPESYVLPLDDFPARSYIILIFSFLSTPLGKKSEIRSSKSETNSKFEIQMFKTKNKNAQNFSTKT